MIAKHKWKTCSPLELLVSLSCMTPPLTEVGGIVWFPLPGGVCGAEHESNLPPLTWKREWVSIWLDHWVMWRGASRHLIFHPCLKEADHALNPPSRYCPGGPVKSGASTPTQQQWDMGRQEQSPCRFTTSPLMSPGSCGEALPQASWRELNSVCKQG